MLTNGPLHQSPFRQWWRAGSATINGIGGAKKINGMVEDREALMAGRAKEKQLS